MRMLERRGKRSPRQEESEMIRAGTIEIEQNGHWALFQYGIDVSDAPEEEEFVWVDVMSDIRGIPKQTLSLMEESALHEASNRLEIDY